MRKPRPRSWQGEGVIREAPGVRGGCRPQLIGNAERIPVVAAFSGTEHEGKDKKNEAATISFSEACKSARK